MPYSNLALFSKPKPMFIALFDFHFSSLNLLASRPQANLSFKLSDALHVCAAATRDGFLGQPALNIPNG